MAKYYSGNPEYVVFAKEDARKEKEELKQQAERERQEREERRLLLQDYKRYMDYGIEPEYFYTQRADKILTGKKCSFIEIANELEEIFAKHFNYSTAHVLSTKERRDRVSEIYYYMSDYDMLDTNVRFLPLMKSGKKIPVGQFISELKTTKSMNARMKETGDTINSCDDLELMMLDAFYTNRVTKIIKHIRNEYGNSDLSRLLKMMRSDLNVKSFDEDTVKDWYDHVDLKERGNTTEDDFIAYTKLENLKINAYAEKDKTVLQAYIHNPENTEWYRIAGENEATNVVMEMIVPGYAFPIALHLNSELIEADFLNHIPTITLDEAESRIYFWPFRFSEKEILQLKTKIDRYIAYNNENKEKPSEPEMGIEASKPIEQTHTEVPARRKRATYRPDTEVIADIESVLVNAGIINGFTDEQKAKMNEKNESDRVKFESKLVAMKNYLIESGVPEDKLELEAAKMFTYMKMTQRGFSYATPKQEVCIRRFNELEMYGDKFFGSLNAGKNPQDLEILMSLVAGDPRTRKIKGAKTLTDTFDNEFSKKETEEPEQSTMEIEEEQEQPQEELSVEDELNQMIQEHNQLKAIEAEIQARKIALEKELSDLINSKGQLKVQKQKYEIALNPKFRAFFNEIEINENIIAEIERKLEQAKAELERLEKEEKDKRTKINETDEELSANKEQQENIKKDVDDFLHGL